MKISIITACYNTKNYIQQTLHSVLSQEYPELEYIVVDGASTDGTCDIINKFSDKISTYISEPDNGQYYAIQKGLELSSGEIMAWINADDIYMPWTLSVVAEIFQQYPEVEWITGLPSFLNENGQLTSIHASPAAYPRNYIKCGWYREHLAGYLQQESMFWRRSLWDKVCGLDLSLDLAADFKLWTQFAQHADLFQAVVPLAAFRKRPGVQRSSVDINGYRSEVDSVCKFLPKPPLCWNWPATKGVVIRSLCRQVQIRKSNLIVYSDVTKKWEKISPLRSISRVSLSRLMLEHYVQEYNRK